MSGRAHDTDVLVVGGSLIGLSTAAFLRHHDVAVTLVERHAGLSRIPRLRLLNGRSMEIYRSVGLEPEIRRHLSLLAELDQMARAESVAGEEIVRIDLEGLADSAGFSPTGHAPIDQHRLEPILHAFAGGRGAELRYGTVLHTLHQDPDGVDAVLEDRADGEVRTVRARYVVACDGHRSTVRDLLGITTDGPGTQKRYATIAVDIAIERHIGDRRIGAWFLDRPTPGTVLLPHDRPGRWVVMVPYYDGDRQNFPGITGIEHFDEATCVRMVRAAVGVDTLEVNPVSLMPGGDVVVDWEFGVTVARSYRDGRVLLAGDAAHLIPPSGGFGANVGVADAHNLAWKLALLTEGRAGEGLLDTYETERRPVAELTAEAAIDRMDKRTAPGGRDPGVEGNLGVVYGYRYPVPDATGPAGPAASFADPRGTRGLPGTRAPHLALRRPGAGTAATVSSIDLFGRDFVLLAGPRGHAWAAAAERVAVEIDLPIGVHRLGADLLDADGLWSVTVGAAADGALLVRPDGTVAWRAVGSGDDPDTDLREALRAHLDLAHRPLEHR